MRQYRKGCGLNGTQLADLINISQGSLSELENNKTLPSADTIASLICYTDLNIRWLLTGEGDVYNKDTINENLPEEVRELLEEVKRVLTCGDIEAYEALKMNILYISKTIDAEKKRKAELCQFKKQVWKEIAKLKRKDKLKLPLRDESQRKEAM